MRLGVVAVSCWCVLLAACFGPDGSAGAGPDAGPEPGGSSGFGGFGGSMGSVGGTGMAGSPVPPRKPIVCGDVECPPPDPSSMLTGLVEQCCTPLGNCSISMPGGECTELAEPDPRCGKLRVSGGELPGCCLDTGLCGVNVEMLGFGCVGPDVLAGLGVMLETRPCIDAGTSDDADAGS